MFFLFRDVNYVYIYIYLDLFEGLVQKNIEIDVLEQQASTRNAFDIKFTIPFVPVLRKKLFLRFLVVVVVVVGSCLLVVGSCCRRHFDPHSG